MKHIALLFVLMNIAAAQNSPTNNQADTSGACSPVIQSNEGKVQFTCNTAMNEATAKKVVSLLNAILKNTDDGNATNKKLDDILEYLKTHLPADWHLTPAQVQSLQQIARTLPSTDHFKIISVQDTNSTVLEQEIWNTFAIEGKATLQDLQTGWSWPSGLPQGIIVITRNEQDVAFPIVKRIKDVLDSSQTLPVIFATQPSIPEGQIKIIVGIRPQRTQ